MLNEQAAPLQPPGYGVTGGDDPSDIIAERDAVQRTMAQLPETLRECLLLSVVGNFSSSEIARMLDLQEAAVRQRLARARKQFQQLYALENGEQITDNGTPATTTGMMQRQAGTDQNNEGRVESRVTLQEEDLLDAPSSLSRRSYGEQFHRNSAAAPLW